MFSPSLPISFVRRFAREVLVSGLATLAIGAMGSWLAAQHAGPDALQAGPVASAPAMAVAPVPVTVDQLWPRQRENLVQAFALPLDLSGRPFAEVMHSTSAPSTGRPSAQPIRVARPTPVPPARPQEIAATIAAVPAAIVPAAPARRWPLIGTVAAQVAGAGDTVVALADTLGGAVWRNLP
ncbi:MAG TPA: hypothetical protein VIL65_05050 [Beijerinckiaceae bacterium]|jgi:hypothetical protein